MNGSAAPQSWLTSFAPLGPSGHPDWWKTGRQAGRLNAGALRGTCQTSKPVIPVHLDRWPASPCYGRFPVVEIAPLGIGPESRLRNPP